MCRVSRVGNSAPVMLAGFSFSLPSETFTNQFVYNQDVLERGIFVGLYLFWHHDIPGFMQGGHVLSRISYFTVGNFGGVLPARLRDIRK